MDINKCSQQINNIGDQTAVKTREIVTCYHLVYVSIDIIVSKGP